MKSKLSLAVVLFLSSISFAGANAATCGLNGTITERMNNCATTKLEWNLVTRTSQGSEVWRDSKTGRLWGDLFPREADFRHAPLFVEAKDACKNAVPQNGNLGIEFTLPTLADVETVDEHDFADVLPNVCSSTSNGPAVPCASANANYEWPTWIVSPDQKEMGYFPINIYTHFMTTDPGTRLWVRCISAQAY